MAFTTLRSTDPRYTDSFAQKAESPVKYADSFAQRAFKWNLLNVWHIKGSLNEEWSKSGGIRDQVCEILQANSERLRPPKSLQNAKSPNSCLGCYLIGRNEHHAQPVAAIISGNEHVRNMSKHIIDEHGILKRLGWVFLRLKADICRPMYSGEHTFTTPTPESRPSTTYAISLDNGAMATPIRTGTSLKVPISPIGIQIVAHRGEWKGGRVATLGGIVEVDGKRYGITAGHILDDHPSCEVTQDDSIELFEEDLQELDQQFAVVDAWYCDSSDSSEENIFQESQIHQSHLQMAGDSGEIAIPILDFSNVEPASYINNAKCGILNLFPADQFVSDSSSLDYAILNLGNGENSFMPHWQSNSFVYKPLNESERLIMPEIEASEVPEYGSEVLLCTGSRGVVTGTSLGSSSSLHLGASKYRMRTWKLSFHCIVQGDCGSWAIDPATSELLGMLVGNCPALNEAYIVPATDLLSHILRQSRAGYVKLPQSYFHQNIVFESANVNRRRQVRATEVMGFRLTASSLFYDVVKFADAATVKYYINRGADINLGHVALSLKTRTKSESTEFLGFELLSAEYFKPLYVAIQRGNIPIVKCLVENGAELDKLFSLSSAEDVEQRYPNRQIREILEKKRRSARDSKGSIAEQASRHDPEGVFVKVGIVALSLDKTKVLILQSSRDGWTLPNGTRKAGEVTAEEAACRHAWEKAGLVCTVSAEIGLVEEVNVEEDSTFDRDQPESSGASKASSKATYRFFEVSADREENEWPESDKRMRNWVTSSKAEFLLGDRPALIEAIRRSSIEREE